MTSEAPAPVTPELVGELLGWRGDACVSLYLPMVVAGPGTRQNPIQLKNALAEAAERLTERGLRTPQAEAILAPAHALLEDPVFWAHQGVGLAVFLDRTAARSCRLDEDVRMLVTVGRRPHLKPLLATLDAPDRWYVLALSQNRIRLLACGRARGDVRDVTPEDMPSDLDEALGHERETSHLQLHTGTADRGAGRRAAIFHGHGVGSDDRRSKILRFCRVVDARLRPVLLHAPAPIVLACVDRTAVTYRSASSVADLVLDAHLSGSPDPASDRDLHERSRALVETRTRSTTETFVRRFRMERAHDRASSDLRAILPAATAGRVAELLVPVGRRIWGAYDSAHDRLRMLAAGDSDAEDLLDLAAVQTLRHGGAVHAVEPEAMPDGMNLGALLRY